MHLRSKTVQQLLSVILSVVMVLSMLPMEDVYKRQALLLFPRKHGIISENPAENRRNPL